MEPNEQLPTFKLLLNQRKMKSRVSTGKGNAACFIMLLIEILPKAQ